MQVLMATLFGLVVFGERISLLSAGLSAHLHGLMPGAMSHMHRIPHW